MEANQPPNKSNPLNIIVNEDVTMAGFTLDE